MSKSLLSRLRSTLSPEERRAASAYRSAIAKKRIFDSKQERLRQEAEFQHGANMMYSPEMTEKMFQTILKNYGVASSVPLANSKITRINLSKARISEATVPYEFYGVVLLRIAVFYGFLQEHSLPKQWKDYIFRSFINQMFAVKSKSDLDDLAKALKRSVQPTYMTAAPRVR